MTQETEMTAQEEKTEMTETIIETADIVEMVGYDEDDLPRDDLSATTDSDPEAKIEFHVQMRSWTERDMGDLIVEAAARVLIGRHGTETVLAKAVQESAIAEITKRANARLAVVAKEVLNQPVLTDPYNKKEPVTIGEMIGLHTREYLTAQVGSDDKWDDSYYGRRTNKPRIQWIVEKALDDKFKAEIERATNAAITEVKAALRAQHTALLTAETARLRAAIAKATELS